MHYTVTRGGNDSLASMCILLALSVTGEKKRNEVVYFHSIQQLKCDSISYILAVVWRCVSNSADEVCSGTGAT